MADLKMIAVTDLRLDQRNARFSFETESQQLAIDALAEHQKFRLVGLAKSIQEEGLDPSQQLMVTPSTELPGSYDVLEGNRRLLALKALETPSLVEGRLLPSEFKKLQRIADEYRAAPIAVVPCVVYFEDELDVANLRIRRRHGGEQGGAGLLEWGSAEKERHAQRHGASERPSFAAQALEFLERVEGKPLPPGAKIRTTLDRMLTSPEIREKLGLKRHRGFLQTTYPSEVVAKALRNIVDDLLAENGTTVTDVYRAEDRRAYADGLLGQVDPTAPGKSIDPVPLHDLSGTNTSGARKSESAPTLDVTRRTASPRPHQRKTIAFRSPKLRPSHSRSKDIYNELCKLDANEFRNAGSVLLRVFLELSVDHYLRQHDDANAEHDNGARSSLAGKMKAVNNHLLKNSAIGKQLHVAVVNMADKKSGLSASAFGFHQYVHNDFVYPQASEIQSAWDEMQPFLEAIWQ